MSDIELLSNFSKSVIESAMWSVLGKLFATYLIAVFLGGAVNYLIGTYTDIGRDDTDPPAGRSEMKIMTDHATGCQYLMSSRGGLTPRLDENGKQMCTK